MEEEDFSWEDFLKGKLGQKRLGIIRLVLGMQGSIKSDL